MLRATRRYRVGLYVASITVFSILVTACGGDSGDDGDAGPSNRAPVIDTAAALATPENQTAVANVQASDADGDMLVFGLAGGADASLFDLNAATGELAFLSAPDFESPEDGDSDNDYELSLTVTDGQGGSDSLDLLISVTDVQQQIQSTVVFPPPAAQFGGHVDLSALVGRLEDIEGDAVQAEDISYVDVDGSLVSPDAGNPALWRTSVPLESRIQTLPIEVAGVSGPVHQSEARFHNAPFMEVTTIDVDEVNNRVVMGGIWSEERIVGVDLASRERYEIAGCTGLYSVRDLHVGASGDTVAVLASERVGSARLWLVDTASGDCTLINQSTISGAGSGSMFSVLLDESGNRVITLDTVYDVVVVTDIATGEKQLFSGGGAGQGPAFDWLSSMTLDTENNRLVVGSYGAENRIFGVDLTTGDRTVLSDAANLILPDKVVLGATDNTVWIQGYSQNFQLVNLGTGIATDMDPDTNGFFFGSINDYSVHVGDGRMFFGVIDDDSMRRLFVMDTEVLEGEEVTSNEVNDEDSAASNLDGIKDMVVHIGRDEAQVLVHDIITKLIRVDLTSGERSSFFLPGMATYRGLRLVDDPAGQRFLMLAESSFTDGGHRLLGIDHQQTQISELSAFDADTGPALQLPEDLVLDSANGRVLLVDSGLDALLTVDLDTGNHSVISDAAIGAGPAFGTPRRLLLDTANDRALVVDGTNGLMAVDLTTGDRTDLLGQQADGSEPDKAFRDIVFDKTAADPTLLGATYATVRKVDLDTGVISLVTGHGHGVEDTPGHQLKDLQAINQDPDTGLILVAGDNTVTVIEGVSGQRAIFSR